jgi:GAF domain-containing protein
VVQRPSRLRALAAMEPNAESSAEALDRIAGMACRLLEAPTVLVNLVGSDRQRLVGQGGDDRSWSGRELPLTHGFCPFALGAEHAFAFADARAEPSLAANPVVAQLGVQAYAGVPLRADGEPIGTLCAIDYAPHAWSEDDLANLSDLAASAVAELQLLAASRRAARELARIRTLAALTYSLAPAASADDVIDELGPAIYRLHASVVWLALLDESGRELRTAAAVGVDPQVVERLPVPPAPQAEFLPTRQDVRDRFEAPPDVGSAALLPLAAPDRCLGVLGVGFEDERALSTEDRAYLAALAGISSLALARGD